MQVASTPAAGGWTELVSGMVVTPAVIAVELPPLQGPLASCGWRAPWIRSWGSWLITNSKETQVIRRPGGNLGTNHSAVSGRGAFLLPP